MLHECNNKHHRKQDNKEGEEEDLMSMDSASDSDSSKSHHDTALGKAGGFHSLRRNDVAAGSG